MNDEKIKISSKKKTVFVWRRKNSSVLMLSIDKKTILNARKRYYVDVSAFLIFCGTLWLI